MANNLENLIEIIKNTDGAVEAILNDHKYGRGSVQEDFNTTAYFAEKAIKAIKEGQHTSGGGGASENESEEPVDPINASEWEVPQQWKYSRDFIYNADDEKYIFMTRQFGNIVRPKSWVKNMVKSYSNWDGDQDTITEICRNFGITRGLFQAIKTSLGLTHDHEPFTPDEVISKSEKEMAMEAHQMKRFRTKIEFDKLDWKETQKEAKKWRELKTSILDEINNDLPTIQVNPITASGIDSKPDTIIVETTDWHLGAEAKNLPSIPDFDSDILKDYLDTIIELVRSDYPDAEVHVHFLGDIMETVTGMNHPTSWQNIENGYYGSKVIMESVDLLLHFLTGLRASKFVAVTGNHGRLTSDRNSDHTGEAELIVYETVNKILSDVEVVYDSFTAMDVVDGIGHVITHGHNRAAKKQDVAEILHKFSSKGQAVDFVMHKQGHTHSRDIKEDNNLFRSYVVPALFTGHRYNQRNGYGNMAGFNIVYRHPFTGKVKLEDFSL